MFLSARAIEDSLKLVYIYHILVLRRKSSWSEASSCLIYKPASYTRFKAKPDLHIFDRLQSFGEVPDVWRKAETATRLQERCFGELQASLPHFSFWENHASSPIKSHFWAHGDDDYLQ